MSDDSRAGRMAVRFTDEDKTWLAEHADDEGVEPATLVRMIINRLRRGRVPLMSMVGGPPAPASAPVQMANEARRAPTYGETGGYRDDDGTPTDDGAPTADDVLQQRLAELDGGEVVHLHAPEEEAAAIPLRRMPRQQYNPGRS